MNKYILLSNADYLETRRCYDKVKEYIKPNSRVTCIPFACDLEYLFKNQTDLQYDGKFYNKHKKHFREYGIKDFNVITPLDNLNLIKWLINTSDVIYFSGGSMNMLMMMLKKYKLLDIIKQLDNKILIAESAGALCLLEYYVVMTNTIPMKYEGIGLIDIVNLFVHYDKENHEELFREFNRFLDCSFKQTLNYAITDNGCLILDNKNIIKVGEIYG